MMDESTYGFNKADASELTQLIGSSDGDYVGGYSRVNTCLYGKTKTGGIVVGTPANVLLYDESGTITTRELLAETRVTDIAADTEIVLFSAYGRWLALRLC